MATSGCVIDSDAYYRCYKALHLVTHEAIPCVEQCLRVWQANQALPCTAGNCPSGKKPKQPASCKNCEDWGKCLQAAVHQSQIVWSNVTPTELSKSHVEIAKAFVLRLPKIPAASSAGASSGTVQQQTYNKIADFDSASLLAIMTRFKPFHGGNQVDVGIIQKVAEMRNELSHMKVGSGMQISDIKVKEYFRNLNAMVDCLARLHPAHLTAPHDVKDELTKIQQEPVTDAMKEDIQIQLRREVEQMREDIAEVKSDVNDIKSGMTKAAVVKDSFDLDQCQKELREFYLDEMSQVPLLQWVPGDTKDMANIFVDPVMIKNDVKMEGNMTSDQAFDGTSSFTEGRYSSRLLTNEDLVSLQESVGKISKRVVVHGKGGTGKSTIASNLAYKWAMKKCNPILSKMSLVFLIRMHEIQDSNTNLVDIIFQQILPVDSKVSKEGLSSYIKSNADEILLILDGLDEDGSKSIQHVKDESSELSQILLFRKMRNVHLILTTRPDQVSYLGKHLKYYTQVELVGFSSENIDLFLRKYFQHDREKGNKLSTKVKGDINIKALASIPVLLLMMSLLWEDNQSLPKTKTQLYRKTILYMWRIYKSKGGEDPSSDEESGDEFCDELNDLILKLGKIGIQKGRVHDGTGWIYRILFESDFDEKDVLELGCRVNILSTGTLRTNLKKKTYVTFLHISILEYCAGVYLASLIGRPATQKEFDKLLVKLYWMDDDTMRLHTCPDAVRFCCGSNPKATRIVLEYLTNLKNCERRILSNFSDQLSHVYESQLCLQEFLELTPLYSRMRNPHLSLIITMENAPYVKYVLELLRSSNDKSVFSMVTMLEIRTGVTPWLSSLIECTKDLLMCCFLPGQDRQVLHSNSYLDTFFQSVSRLPELKKLIFYRDINSPEKTKFDVTKLLTLLTNKKRKLITLVVMGFSFDEAEMTRFLTMSKSLPVVQISGSVSIPPITVADNIIKAFSRYEGLRVLTMMIFRVSVNVIPHLTPVMSQLGELSLGCCFLDEIQLMELFSILHNAQALQVLNLSGNFFSERAVASLLKCLTEMNTLKKLDLTCTFLNDECACILGRHLLYKTTLQTLQLDHNPGIGPRGRRELCLVYLLMHLRKKFASR